MLHVPRMRVRHKHRAQSGCQRGVNIRTRRIANHPGHICIKPQASYNLLIRRHIFLMRHDHLSEKPLDARLLDLKQLLLAVAFRQQKGDREEQLFKVEQSGVERFFREVVVAHEKNVATYEEIVRRLGLDANMTWMIGNSPRSDINPALAAGLRAVFVPHPHTWHMEHEEVTPVDDGRLLTLSRFAELRNYF